MELRKVYRFNGTLGFSLPAKYAKAMDLHWHDYVEITMEKDGAVTARKHQSTRPGRKDHA